MGKVKLRDGLLPCFDPPAAGKAAPFPFIANYIKSSCNFPLLRTFARSTLSSSSANWRGSNGFICPESPDCRTVDQPSTGLGLANHPPL